MTQLPADQAEPSTDRQSQHECGKRVIRSSDVFAGQRMVIIEHAGERYRMLITKNDRLILQK